MPNLNSIPLKTKELLMYHCGCHDNLVAAIKQRSFLASMNSIQVNTKELLRLHSGCHGTLLLWKISSVRNKIFMGARVLDGVGWGGVNSERCLKWGGRRWGHLKS